MFNKVLGAGNSRFKVRFPDSPKEKTLDFTIYLTAPESLLAKVGERLDRGALVEHVVLEHAHLDVLKVLELHARQPRVPHLFHPLVQVPRVPLHSLLSAPVHHVAKPILYLGRLLPVDGLMTNTGGHFRTFNCIRCFLALDSQPTNLAWIDSRKGRGTIVLA
jgi:hypothetical protein